MCESVTVATLQTYELYHTMKLENYRVMSQLGTVVDSSSFHHDCDKCVDFSISVNTQGGRNDCFHIVLMMDTTAECHEPQVRHVAASCRLCTTSGHILGDTITRAGVLYSIATERILEIYSLGLDECLAPVTTGDYHDLVVYVSMSVSQTAPRMKYFARTLDRSAAFKGIFLERLYTEFTDQSFTDALVVVEDHETGQKTQFRASKFILSAFSAILKATLDASTGETDRPTWIIRDASKDAVENLLSTLHSGSIQQIASIDDGIALLALAEKYQLWLVKLEYERLLVGHIALGTFCPLLVAANSYGAEMLKHACYKFFALYHSEVMAGASWKDMKCKHPLLIADLLEARMTRVGDSDMALSDVRRLFT